MAFSVMKSLAKSHSPSSSSPLRLILSQTFLRSYAKSSSPFPEAREKDRVVVPEPEPERLRFGGHDDDVVPTSGISRPLSEILKELNKRVPDSLIKLRMEDDFSVKYIPWHIVNRIMNLHAPEWSGDVRSITYSADGKSVSVVYRVTLYGTDAEIYRESTGTASVDDTGYGDPVQKAEAMAFRRACARLGLGLHLYHEDML